MYSYLKTIYKWELSPYHYLNLHLIRCRGLNGIYNSMKETYGSGDLRKFMSKYYQGKLDDTK